MNRWMEIIGQADCRWTDGQTEARTEILRGQIAVLTCGIYLMSVTPIFIYEK